ncbi:hypothetical protein EAX62_11270 [Tessaracoccus antarcticus]|uniref:Uncharacterized protein n=2 Tax=Tessaracoccus antarcticus TaxID=2479848 RepID=A0A3M0GAU8_9ACTN|nr:hypothetical protein EAX62_11270 [Tessaracoccus antarcticus]
MPVLWESTCVEYSIEQVAQRLERSTLQPAFASEALRQVRYRREQEGRATALWSESDLDAAKAEVGFMNDQEVEEQLARD